MFRWGCGNSSSLVRIPSALTRTVNRETDEWTFDAQAADVECGLLCGGDVDLQTQLLQGPAVVLGHILTDGRDVGLRDTQAAQAHMDVLDRRGMNSEWVESNT